MNFKWRRPVTPLILAIGLLLCFAESAQVGLGVSLVAFALIIGFWGGKSRED